MSTNLAPQERFWKKVHKSSYCWLWTASKDKDGYGTIKIDYVQYLAHRVSYVWEYGTIPEGMNILHKCDNPSCVRPSHLEAGTQIKNILDAYIKGRKYPQAGILNGHAKLTDEEVAEIRELVVNGVKQTEIAARFGIDNSYVSHLKTIDLGGVSFVEKPESDWLF